MLIKRAYEELRDILLDKFNKKFLFQTFKNQFYDLTLDFIVHTVKWITSFLTLYYTNLKKRYTQWLFIDW